MSKKIKAAHTDKFASKAAEANKALIALNKRWDNRVVVDTALPQAKQESTSKSTQLEEPLAQWELDMLAEATTQSSDERPVINWAPEYEDIDYFDQFDGEEPNYCKVCWVEAGDHRFELEQRHDNTHVFTSATPQEYAAHKAEVDELQSFYAEESRDRRFTEQHALGNTDFAYGS